MYNSNKTTCNLTCHNGWKLQPTNLSRRKVKPLILKVKSNTYSTSCLTSRFQNDRFFTNKYGTRKQKEEHTTQSNATKL